MPTIELPDPLYARFRRLAIPLEDTAVTLFTRMLEVYERQVPRDEQDETHELAPTAKSAARAFDPTSPPRLTHTMVLSAKINGVSMRKPSWNGLLTELIRRAKRQLMDGDKRKLLIVNFVEGRKEDWGYRFIPEVGLSVQGQDANSAWRGACHLARELGIRVEVEFLWRHKRRAAFPGTKGCFAA